MRGWRTSPDRLAAPRTMIGRTYVVITACSGQPPLQAPTKQILDFRMSATCVMDRICNDRVRQF